MTGAAVEITGLTRRFSPTSGVWPCDLSLAAGSFFCLLGPSGGGKTSLLRLIGGYLAPDAGGVSLGGIDVTATPLETRRIAMVFQDFALFPHLSASANVAFGLDVRRRPRAEIRDRVAAMLTGVGLPPARWSAKPATLSGGERQRVALARALILEPALLLLDEPLSSLDRMLRQDLRAELRALQQRSGVTTLMVTHDPDDALMLADRIGVMRDGRLIQVGSPATLYDRPADPFVARLLGDANFLMITRRDAGGIWGGADWRLAGPPDGGVGLGLGTGDLLMVRPESLILSSGFEAGPDQVRARVRSIRHLGADLQVIVDLPDGITADGVLHVRVRAGHLPMDMVPGDPVFVRVAGSAHALAGGASWGAAFGGPSGVGA